MYYFSDTGPESAIDGNSDSCTEAAGFPDYPNTTEHTPEYSGDNDAG